MWSYNAATDQPAARARLWLYAILGAAFALRAWVAVTQNFVLFPDEIFQYYEQAHRLVFGSGVVPWEFHDGARSWFLPGVLAAIMTLCAWVDPGSVLYIPVIRIVACACSLSVVWVAFRLGLRSGGLAAAVLCGALASIWFDAVRFAPSVMTEIAAAYAALGAIWLAERRDPADTRATMVLAGFLLGLACSLRFQMAPTLLVIALFHCRLEWSKRWLPLLLSGAATMALLLGALDFVTWGVPFQSLIVNFVRNVPEGLSTAISSTPPGQYLESLVAYWTVPGLFLAAFIPLGMLRAPALGAAVLVTLVVHSLLGHKEYRFICFALLSAPILIGLGANRVFELFETRSSALEQLRARAAFAALCTLLSAYAWIAGGGRVMRDYISGTLTAFLAAHDERQLCGLGVLGMGWARTGGYSFLDRDVPIFYSEFHNSQNVVALLRRQGVDLKLTVMDRGRDLPQFEGDAFARHAGAFNFLVADSRTSLPGYVPVACFENSPLSDNPKVCLERRPGNCDADETQP
jgi:GPI mannosyltransferase 3